MYGMNDYEMWKHRAEEMRREVENQRMVKGRRSRRVLPALVWELRRFGGWFGKLLR